MDRSGERRHLVDGSPAAAEHAELRPPLAIFLPERLALVKGPPGLRRAHLDRLCAALWPARAEARRRYGRALAQRNALLGRIRSDAATVDSLVAWDRELATVGLELIAEPPTGGRSAGARGSRRRRPSSACRASPRFATCRAARPPTRRSWPAELRERRRHGSGAGLHLARPASGRAGDRARRTTRCAATARRESSARRSWRCCSPSAVPCSRRGRSPPLMLLDDVMSELDAAPAIPAGDAACRGRPGGADRDRARPPTRRLRARRGGARAGRGSAPRAAPAACCGVSPRRSPRPFAAALARRARPGRAADPAGRGPERLGGGGGRRGSPPRRSRWRSATAW